MKDYKPVPFLTQAELDAHRKRMNLTMIAIYAISVPLILMILWYALR